MTRYCRVCGIDIPEARLRALPTAVTCIKHSTASKFAANVVNYGNPEAGDLTTEIEILRDEKVIRKCDEYGKQIGSYK
jgi:hypothetical protein